MSHAADRRRKKRILLERQGHRCAYCLVTLAYEEATLDHLEPTQCRKKRYSKMSYDNLIVACFSCNNRRGTRDPLRWFDTVQRRLKRLLTLGKLDDPRRIAA